MSGEVAKFPGLEFGNFAVNKSCNWDISALVIIYRALLKAVISRCFPALQQTHTDGVKGKY